MRLSEMLTAIREYPALKIQYEAMREQQASQERTAVQLSIAYMTENTTLSAAGGSRSSRIRQWMRITIC